MSARGRRIGLVLVSGIALVLVVWQIAWRSSVREPRVKGKALSFWVRALYSNKNPLIAEARAAIEELGTNGIPYFLYLVQKQDTPVTKLAIWLNTHLPRLHLFVTTASQWHDCAVSAVKILGWRADPFAPEFQRLLDNPEAARNGVVLLTFCGSNAIPSLCVALTNSDSQVRGAAAYDLGLRHMDSERVVPRLLQSLKDNDPFVRHMSAYALSKFTNDAERITPALIDSLRDSDSEARSFAAQALGDFGASASNAVPALIQFLQEEPNNMTAPAALTKISPEAARSIGREIKLPESFE